MLETVTTSNIEHPPTSQSEKYDIFLKQKPIERNFEEGEKNGEE